MKASEDGESREARITLRCGFCLSLNRVEPAKAGGGARCGKCERPIRLDRPREIQEKDFRRTVLDSGIPVLVDFFADWCGPCKMIAPLVDEIAGEREGELLVVKVDTDRAPELTEEVGIRGVPTLILFQGGEEVGRSAGYEPEKVRSMVDSAIS